MSYLNLTKDKIEERLSFFKDKIKDEAKNKVEENIECQKSVVCSTFSISLIILGVNRIISIYYNDSALVSTISFYVGVISFMAFTGSILFAFFIYYLESNKERYLERIYKKVCKGYCEEYKVDNLEDNDSLQKILTSIFAGELLEEKTDTEIYTHLYEHRMLKPEQLDKIDKFLESG